MEHNDVEHNNDLAAMRRRYQGAGLQETDLAGNWAEQFSRWMGDAIAAELYEPNAMVLGTVSPDGRPVSRTVLLKSWNASGFVFFTNYGSRKARHLAANPHASLLFPWYRLARQVGVTGLVRRIPEAASASYFRSRPRGSQLGAWASRQSSPVASREVLDRRFAELDARYPDEVPVPPFWGGFQLEPDSVEFWQGRDDRLHDRLRFEAPEWRALRIAP